MLVMMLRLTAWSCSGTTFGHISESTLQTETPNSVLKEICYFY